MCVLPTPAKIYAKSVKKKAWIRGSGVVFYHKSVRMYCKIQYLTVLRGVKIGSELIDLNQSLHARYSSRALPAWKLKLICKLHRCR